MARDYKTRGAAVYDRLLSISAGSQLVDTGRYSKALMLRMLRREAHLTISEPSSRSEECTGELVDGTLLSEKRRE